MDEDVKAAFWKRGTNCLVAIENHRKTSNPIAIAVPTACQGTKLAGADADGVTLSAGELRGIQEPLRVRVFTLSP